MSGKEGEHMTNGEMRMQTADPKKMKCRDCIYRDQDKMEMDGETVYVGVMRATCLIFDGKRGNYKPTAVNLRNEDCLFYERDENAERFWEGKKK